MHPTVLAELKHLLGTTAPLSPSGNGRKKACRRRGVLRKQNLKDPLPNPLFAPAAVMIHDGLPWSEVLGQVSPGARRARDPEHGFDAPAPSDVGRPRLGCADSNNGRSCSSRRIGERRQTGQTDRHRPRVRRCNSRGLASAAQQVVLLRSGLMGSAEARPPYELRALLLCHLKPSDQSADFGDAELETGRRVRTFFSRAL